MKLTLIAIQEFGTDIRSFIFESDRQFKWLPGQYLHYTLKHKNEDDRGNERWFTIASPPSSGKVQITTRITSEKGSSFKKALLALRIGDEIEADGPEGDFVVSDPSRNLIFVAGGIGVTPFHSILTEADALNQKLHIHLLYANRTQEVPFRDELNAFATRNPQLTIEYIIQPQKIDKEILKESIESLEDPLIYVSGPEPMVETFVAYLTELDIAEANIKTDFFPGYKDD